MRVAQTLVKPKSSDESESRHDAGSPGMKHHHHRRRGECSPVTFRATLGGRLD